MLLHLKISIHALLAESDSWLVFEYQWPDISIHALLAESDLGNVVAGLRMLNFYPRSPCGERHLSHAQGRTLFRISIHALLAESDAWQSARRGLAPGDFYPRSPCGERLCFLCIISRNPRFLSTLSLRRATCPISCTGAPPIYFYPRSPCGERQCRVRRTAQPAAISIHALLAESDTPMVTPPSYKHNFYPRSPCGERRRMPLSYAACQLFLSTLSLRRATCR